MWLFFILWDNKYQLFTETEVASRGFLYRAAKQRGKFSPLATDTEVNNCFSIHLNSEIIERKKLDIMADIM